MDTVKPPLSNFYGNQLGLQVLFYGKSISQNYVVVSNEICIKNVQELNAKVLLKVGL